MGRAADPNRMTQVSQIVPPQLRGRSLDNINAYLDRVVNEMLELPPTYLDLIHDDFGTLPRLMMANVEDMSKTGRGWFGKQGTSGGLPFATPRLTEDGSLGFQYSAIQAAGIMFRSSWGDIVAAEEAGIAASRASQAAPEPVTLEKSAARSCRCCWNI